MKYNADYFKPENAHLYPQLHLNQEEYLIFVNKCDYLDFKLRGFRWSVIFENTDYGAPHVILDNQLIGIILPFNQNSITFNVIEKFYYKIYFKYLEEKLNELTENTHIKNLKMEDRLSDLSSSQVNCKLCQDFHNGGHIMPIVTSGS